MGESDIEDMEVEKDVEGLIKALNINKGETVRERAMLPLVRIGKPAVEALI